RASKAALNMFLKTAAIEIARKRPQAVCLALHPGTVETPLSAPFAGDRALLSAQQAAKLLLNVIDEADNDGAGSFLAYDGQEIAW
ncbi:MAG: short-chain dehydrogenase, partial [Pseudomonadota bacterium]